MAAGTVVALDGMGGDNAPAAPVSGALEVAAEGYEILLVGDESVLRAELSRQGARSHPGIELVHAPDVISSGEDGARAMRSKPGSSVATACRLVGEGRAGAAVSAGNTGAMLAAATLSMRRVPGVIRPAIAVVLPSAGGAPVVLLDAGASAEARAEHFPQLAADGAALRPGRPRASPARGWGSCRSARRRARAARSCRRPTPCCSAPRASWATWRGATSPAGRSTSWSPTASRATSS